MLRNKIKLIDAGGRDRVKEGVLRDPIVTIVSIINEVATFVISVDIPTGLPADEGIDDSKSVQADYTIVVSALKICEQACSNNKTISKTDSEAICIFP